MLADVLERTRDQVAEELERRTAVTESTELRIAGRRKRLNAIRRRSDRSPAPRWRGRLSATARRHPAMARWNCGNASWCAGTSSSRSNRSSSTPRPARRSSSRSGSATAERTRLREQNQRLRTLLDDVQDSAALFGPDGRILYCNLPAFQRPARAHRRSARRDHRPDARRAGRPRRAGDRPPDRRDLLPLARGARIVRDDRLGTREGRPASMPSTGPTARSAPSRSWSATSTTASWPRRAWIC